jgi:hypothetical protein
MTLNTLLLGFISGFVSVLIFHQGLWAIFRSQGKAPAPAWDMTPSKPLGVPQVISSAIWGGLWGIVLLALWPMFGRTMGYWPFMIIIGALLTTIVALCVVFPLKGKPFAADWKPEVWIFALAVNAAWGLGVGILLKLFSAY